MIQFLKKPFSSRVFNLALIIMAAGLSVFYVSCGISHPKMIDQEVYIPVKDNELYVRLAGNEKAPIIVMLHGGPGGSSGFDRAFYKGPMEAQYLMAYLDQRGSGKSPSEDNDRLITMEQFVADLDVVIDTLHRQYPQRPIHLLGSSWGGTLGFLYLLKHQKKIRSFICVSGKVDALYENKVLIDHEKELAQQQLAALSDKSSLRADSLRHILVELNRIQTDKLDDFFEEVNLLKYKFPAILGFNPYWFDTAAHHRAVAMGKDSMFYVNAHYDMASYDSVNAKATHVNKVFRRTPAYNQLQLTQQLAGIHIPVAVIGGAEDYVVGPGQAGLIYEGLTGLKTGEKELHIIQGAAHNVNFEAPDRFYPILKAFLGKHP